MSWSINLAGRKAAILANVDEKFNANKCGDGFPIEQKIKDACREIVRAAAEGSADNTLLVIEAGGSASSSWDGKKNGPETSQSVRLEIKQIYGLLE